MDEELLKGIMEPVVPSTRLKPESLVERWTANKVPGMSILDGVARLDDATEKVLIRASYHDDQGRRCIRYIAELFIYDGDGSEALELAAKWATEHNCAEVSAEFGEGAKR
jgi:hypothetical protein